MVYFWLVLFLMTLVALAFVILPLWRRLPSTPDINLGAVIEKEKLAELKRNYNESLSANRLLSVSGGFLFTATAVLLYQHWGALPAIEKTAYILQKTQMVQAEIATLGSPKEIIHQMQEKIQEHPDDYRGWYLLGRLYFSTGQFELAIDSYQHAMRLKPDDPEIMTAVAESQFFLQGRKLDAQAASLLKSVLQQYPNYTSALNLLAVNAYVNKNYETAINYWQRILMLLAPNSKETEQIQALINEAQTHAALK